MNNWSELLERSREESSSLSLSCMRSSLLSGWLVEPGLNESLPVFTKMYVGELIVVLNHLAN